MFIEPNPQQLEVIKFIVENEFPRWKENFFYKDSVQEVVYENSHFKFWILKGLNKNVRQYHPTFINAQSLKEIPIEEINKYQVSDFEKLELDIVEKKFEFKNYYPLFEKYEIILRFSKTYGQLELYRRSKKIDYILKQQRVSRKTHKISVRDINRWLLIKKVDKCFNLLATNYSYIFFRKQARYISMKNFLHMSASSNLALKLLNIHLRSNYNFSGDDLKIYNLSNKLTKGKDSLIEVIKERNPLIPKILTDNFDVMELMEFSDLIENNEITKLVMFIKAHPKVFKKFKNNLCYHLYSRRDNFNMSNKMNWVLYLYMGNNLGIFTKAFLPEYDVEYFEAKPEHLNQLTILRDYINITDQIKAKINLNITSLQRLKFLHDEVSVIQRSMNTPEINVNNKDFPDFAKMYEEFLKENNIEFELIQDSKRLVFESVDMCHCVSSYHSQINKGLTAIYHVDYLKNDKKEKLTLQLNFNSNSTQKKQIYRAQLKGVWNTSPTNEASSTIDAVIKKFHDEQGEEELNYSKGREAKRAEGLKERPEFNFAIQQAQPHLFGEIFEEFERNDADLPF